MFQYRIGQKILPPCSDGVVFDMTDEGAILIFNFSSPTDSEKKEFDCGIRVKFCVVDDIIFILSRLGHDDLWQDAPYYRYISQNLTHIPHLKERQGISVHAMLVDASTGMLVSQKLFSIDHDTSFRLMEAIRRQPEIPNYKLRLHSVMSTYSTQDLVEVANANNIG